MVPSLICISYFFLPWIISLPLTYTTFFPIYQPSYLMSKLPLQPPSYLQLVILLVSCFFKSLHLLSVEWKITHQILADKIIYKVWPLVVEKFSPMLLKTIFLLLYDFQYNHIQQLARLWKKVMVWISFLVAGFIEQDGENPPNNAVSLVQRQVHLAYWLICITAGFLYFLSLIRTICTPPSPRSQLHSPRGVWRTALWRHIETDASVSSQWKLIVFVRELVL